jgi:hypothetical protein
MFQIGSDRERFGRFVLKLLGEKPPRSIAVFFARAFMGIARKIRSHEFQAVRFGPAEVFIFGRSSSTSRGAFWRSPIIPANGRRWQL